MPVQLRAEWQENSDSPCDTGTPLNLIANDFPQFDFNAVDPEYPAKTGRYEYSQTAITQRGIDCRRWLKSRPEKVIAVVSHSAFLRLAVCHSRFENADYRIFDFKSEGDNDTLFEWESTEDNGGGMGRSRKGHFTALPGDFPRIENPGQLSIDTAHEEVVSEVPEGDSHRDSFQAPY